MSANLSPLRDWYREHAPQVQLDSTHWSAALHSHTLEDLTLAVELIDLPEGNLPTPALVNGLLAEVRAARDTVQRRAGGDRGLERFRADRKTGFAAYKSDGAVAS